MTSKARGASGGFTLVEILVVILIIIIISAASIPMGLNFVKHYKITGAAQGLATQVQMARAQAVKRNTSRGILLTFNYPAPGQYQFTSLDPDPLTGNWDGGIYPANPGVFNLNTPAYGTVPDPPKNVEDPIDVRVQSPHGTPVELPLTLDFDAGVRNALLFRADGSVAPVNANGPVGAPALSQDPNRASEWLLTIRDPITNLTKVIRVSTAGRVQIDP